MTPPNHQRMERTEARVGRPLCPVGSSRRASFPSGVEPARPVCAEVRSAAVSFAFCFLRRSWAASTYEQSAGLRQPQRGLSPPSNGPIMTERHRHVQRNSATAGAFSVNDLTPESCNARQVRRGAAGFNHALQRTRRGRRGCNRCVPWAGSLSLGR